MRKIILILSAVLLSYFVKAQGPIDGYMKSAGELDVTVSYGYDHYEKYFLGDQLQDTFNRTYQSASVFFAYGLDDNLDFIASVPYMWSDGENRGFQDGQFFLKYRYLKKEQENGRFDAMVAGGVTTALSSYRISPESNNPIGERPTILEVRTVIQQNKWSGFFFSAKTGLSYKVRPVVQTSIPSLVRVGYGHSKFYTDFWVEGVFALNAEANEVPLGQEGSTFVKFGGTFYLPVGKQFGVFVNGAYTPWGRNASQSPRLGAGFVMKFKFEEK